MNVEFEVKNIIRMDATPECKAKLIIGFTNFEKENIIKAIEKKGEKPSIVYQDLVRLSK